MQWLKVIGGAIASRRATTANPATKRPYTQKEFARLAGIGESTMPKIEKGTAPTASGYEKAAKRLGLEISAAAHDEGVTLSVSPAGTLGSQQEAFAAMLNDKFVLEVASSVNNMPTEHRGRFLQILRAFRDNPDDVVIRRGLHTSSRNPQGG